MAADVAQLDQEIQGLDRLETPQEAKQPVALRVWNAVWPKLGAIALALGLWQLVVLSGWKAEYLLPGPVDVFAELWRRTLDGSLVEATFVTLQRGASGFALALVIGVIAGSLVARIRVLRAAFGSFITGLQTMPSVAWVPLAILLFPFSGEQAIFFVVVLGAAPSIANGLISGVDQIPPLWLRAGHVLGARGLSLYRHVILPAALPNFVAGLKQGWAFAWRSLMAGELIVTAAGHSSLGHTLQISRDLGDAHGLLATMIIILAVGILVDSLIFGQIEQALLRRRGLLEDK